ncbi:cell division protein [Kineobactrum sediminis]|uniref:Cell division protein FtsX n=1 Tax=Kineobactrum sediminis TaxID=1905677 RepID=A0A2N5Y5U4_9GAMM|nr:cell division protein [Kineobactrum sediminis]
MSLRQRYNGWLAHHRQSASDSLERIFNAPVSSVLTWLVIGIALALPAALEVGLSNARQISDGWNSPAQLSLFMKDSVTAVQTETLREELLARPDIAEVIHISRDEALREFTALSGFADVLDSLEQNPLPNLLLVTPVSGANQSMTLHAELAADPRVAEAVMDMAWLQRLNNLMELGQRLVLALGGILVAGVVLILGNTIRLAIESRREEIVIVKLVGGSNAFVRRPFLYTGLWYGVGGGFFAALLVATALWFLGAPVADLAQSYQSTFRLGGLGIMGSLNLVILGGLLGLTGAWLAVSRHLGSIAPR